MIADYRLVIVLQQIMSLVGLLSHYLLRLLTDCLFVLLVVSGGSLYAHARLFFLLHFLFWISVAEAVPLMGLACVLQRFYRSTRFRLTPSLQRYSELDRTKPERFRPFRLRMDGA